MRVKLPIEFGVDFSLLINGVLAFSVKWNTVINYS